MALGAVMRLAENRVAAEQAAAALLDYQSRLVDLAEKTTRYPPLLQH
jgi:hypothetical protein